VIIAEYLRDKNYLQIILHYFIKYDDYGIYVFYAKKYAGKRVQNEK